MFPIQIITMTTTNKQVSIMPSASIKCRLARPKNTTICI